MTISRKQTKALVIGVAFLLPNIIGFLCFTFVPLVTSLMMSFTNWDLRYHNLFNGGTISFIGLEHFKRLLSHPDFWQYLGNTLFLMLGIPFSIAASLMAALLLNRQPRSSRQHRIGMIIAGVILGVASTLLILVNGQGIAFSLLIGGLLCLLMTGGSIGGSTFYRTIYYLPNFTAGVATYLMWKKMYDPRSGPVNAFLQPLLDRLSGIAATLPSGIGEWLQIVVRVGCLLLLAWGISALIKYYKHEYFGRPEAIRSLRKRMVFRSIVLLSLCGFLWSAGGWCVSGVQKATIGLQAPEWLTDYYWAKPAIMIMGFWAAIGSNNMLLYLAGLSNIPEDLNEAANIDGAGAWSQFCHVTWPQLAPITFFIVIMSVIGGLQGGFEMARTMTQGGPGGATTTLSYFVYSEGFETGRLGYASAVAWTLFLLVLIATFFNWKFGQANHE